MISSHATTQQQWKLDFRHTHSRRLQTPSRVVLLGMCCPFALPATMLYTGTYQERDKEGNSMIKKATLYTMLGRCLLLSCPCQRNRGRGGALTRFHLSIFFFHRGCSRGLRRKPAALPCLAFAWPGLAWPGLAWPGWFASQTSRMFRTPAIGIDGASAGRTLLRVSLPAAKALMAKKRERKMQDQMRALRSSAGAR